MTDSPSSLCHQTPYIRNIPVSSSFFFLLFLPVLLSGAFPGSDRYPICTAKWKRRLSCIEAQKTPLPLLNLFIHIRDISDLSLSTPPAPWRAGYFPINKNSAFEPAHSKTPLPLHPDLYTRRNRSVNPFFVFFGMPPDDSVSAHFFLDRAGRWGVYYC